MSFNLIKPKDPIIIDINSLTPQMIQDLITFYSYDIDPFDVQMNSGIFEKTGIVIDYYRIEKDVVKNFYDQLDGLKSCVIDVVVGNYHTGLKALIFSENEWHYINKNGTTNGLALQEDIDAWIWGETPLTIESLIEWTFFVIKRDFFSEEEWIYTYSEGDFDQIKPFIEFTIYLMLYVTTGGDYDLLVNLIKENYPFTQS
jgi:hypothetical protein